MGRDEPFGTAHAEGEIEGLVRSAQTIEWTTPQGETINLTVPPTVYPPREDTSLLASVLNRQRLSPGTRWLEIGCGSGALSAYAAGFGCDITACDVNPLAVACTRQYFSEKGTDARVLEGGPGPIKDGGTAQWGGDLLYDVVVWNTPYLSPSILDSGSLGPMEEAAFTDTDSKGLHVRLFELLAKGQLLTEQGIAYITVSSKGFAHDAQAEAWCRGLAARTVAQTRFDDGEVLSVLALWRPFRGSPIQSVESTKSTNDDVLDLSSQAGASVRAQQQSDGRGRRGRAWINTEGAMMASWLVADGNILEHHTMDQLRVGEALVHLLRAWSQCRENDVCLKWPNDVYVRVSGGRLAKAGGVLFEAVSQGRNHRLVLGVGVNIDAPKASGFAGLRSLGLDVDASSLHASIHATVASVFERLQGVPEPRFDSDRIEAAVMHGIGLLGNPLYREKELAVNGIDDAGALRVEGGEHVVDDPDSLTWSTL